MRKIQYTQIELKRVRLEWSDLERPLIIDFYVDNKSFYKIEVMELKLLGKDCYNNMYADTCFILNWPIGSWCVPLFFITVIYI